MRQNDGSVYQNAADEEARIHNGETQNVDEGEDNVSNDVHNIQPDAIEGSTGRPSAGDGNGDQNAGDIEEGENQYAENLSISGVEFMKKFLSTEVQEHTGSEICSKIEVLELIESYRVELTEELGLDGSENAAEIASCIKVKLEHTSVWGTALRRWFRATEELPKLISCWTSIYVVMILAGKINSQENTYWKLLQGVLESAEMRRHFRRMYVVTRELGLECAQYARQTCSGGPEWALDRWEGRTFRKSIRSILEVLNSRKALEKAGSTVLSAHDALQVYSANGDLKAGEGSQIPTQAFDHRNEIFDATTRPLVDMIAETVTARTQACAPIGFYIFAGLIVEDPYTAACRARSINRFWQAIVSIEQNESLQCAKSVREKITVMTENVAFRIACLRVEEWLCLLDNDLLAEAQAERGHKTPRSGSSTVNPQGRPEKNVGATDEPGNSAEQEPASSAAQQ